MLEGIEVVEYEPKIGAGPAPAGIHPQLQAAISKRVAEAYQDGYDTGFEDGRCEQMRYPLATGFVWGASIIGAVWAIVHAL